VGSGRCAVCVRPQAAAWAAPNEQLPAPASACGMAMFTAVGVRETNMAKYALPAIADLINQAHTVACCCRQLTSRVDRLLNDTTYFGYHNTSPHWAAPKKPCPHELVSGGVA
jgi:hypothetical protein